MGLQAAVRHIQKRIAALHKKSIAADLNTVILAMLSSRRVVGGDTGGG
jgi:hypothetical protein